MPRKVNNPMPNNKRFRVSSQLEFNMILKGLDKQYAHEKKADNLANQFCVLELIGKMKTLRDK